MPQPVNGNRPNSSNSDRKSPQLQVDFTEEDQQKEQQQDRQKGDDNEQQQNNEEDSSVLPVSPETAQPMEDTKDIDGQEHDDEAASTSSSPKDLSSSTP